MDHQAFNEQVGHLIRQERERLNWSQKTLALKCGIGQSFLSEIESGVHGVSAERLAIIARVLHVDRLALQPSESLPAKEYSVTE